MWSGCKVCKWGRAACPLQPLRFFKDKLPAHKKPILNCTSSPTDLSTAVPDFHTRKRLPHENALGAFTEKVFMYIDPLSEFSGELKQLEVLGSRQPQL